MSHKIFDNNLVAMRKSEIILTIKKLAYIGMRILDLSKVSMYEFHYDYIKKNVKIKDCYLQKLIV